MDVAGADEPDVDSVLQVHRALDRSSHGTVLMLSRVEVLTSAPSLALLDQLVADLPAGVQLVLDTRRRPPLSLDRLRAAGRLDEIGSGALRLDSAEAATLLERLAAGPVDDAVCRRLLRHTGGWPAALYLTARALRDGADLPSEDARLHPDVIDFVTTEVINHYDPDTLDLLARVSAIGDCNADLVGEVTGDPTAPARFEALRRADPIIEPVGTGGTRYRVEPLIRAVAPALVDQERRDVVASTRLRASAVLASRGEVDAALRHAVVVGDPVVVRDGGVEPALEPASADPVACRLGAADTCGRNRGRRPRRPRRALARRGAQRHGM